MLLDQVRIVGDDLAKLLEVLARQEESRSSSLTSRKNSSKVENFSLEGPGSSATGSLNAPRNPNSTATASSPAATASREVRNALRTTAAEAPAGRCTRGCRRPASP